MTSQSNLETPTTSAVRAACRQILEEYLADPWRWPRESDLVVDLVNTIRRQLELRKEPTSTVVARIVDKDFLDTKRYEKLPNAQSQIPRVRTELKLTDDENDNRSKERTDIGVLKSTPATVFLEPNGVRDVSLRVNADDVEALVEVKLCPHLYVEKRSGEYVSMWVDDLVKLYHIGRDHPTIASRVLLCIDSCLPLEVAGIRYRYGEWVTNRANERRDQSMPDVVRLWPLMPNKPSRLRSYPERNKKGNVVAKWNVDLIPCDHELETSGLQLWAIGVKESACERPFLPSRGNAGATLAEGDLTASCWRVEITKADATR